MWVVIVSITGYFTILDLGINTAIVKYVSEYYAKNDERKVRQIYSTCLIAFMILAGIVLLVGLLIGLNLDSFLDPQGISNRLITLTFLIVVIDMALGMFFSVNVGTLAALQEFIVINSASILASLAKSALIVYFLLSGYSILSMAIIQVATSLLRYIYQYVYLKKKYNFIYFQPKSVNKDLLTTIYRYSLYSFIIAIALKILFYTDSLVIGKIIGLNDVTYYAIPSTLLDYIEKFVWAMIAVLLPVISGNDALGQSHDNQKIYILGTRYSLLISAPVIISLYFVGSDFITLWMGEDIGANSTIVLKILLIGYGVAFSQLVAHGILKGIAKHRILALVLIVEALVNLVLSIVLAGGYGIAGVAIGTAVPLILASIILSVYTCRCLGLNILSYYFRGYLAVSLIIVVVATLANYFIKSSQSYFMVFGQSFILLVLFMILAVPLCVERDHLQMILSKSPFLKR